MENIEYAGFWIRTGAAIIDSILMLIIVSPLLTAIYGINYWNSELIFNGTWDVLLNYIFPAIAVVIFWVYKSATPGKMATKLTIVDARTGQHPTTQQFIIRYLCYYVSLFPLGLGILWVAFDKRKQGWHDMIANTVVIKNNQIEPVRFEG
ncbi:MAG: RDD family protein [Methylococcaceae bacterium]|nr:RDD family protein [Methylococcaceae bacterium]